MLRKGQSTLEYVLVLTAIIAAVVAFATLKLKPQVTKSLNSVSDKMGQEVEKINFGK